MEPVVREWVVVAVHKFGTDSQRINVYCDPTQPWDVEKAKDRATAIRKDLRRRDPTVFVSHQPLILKKYGVTVR